MKKIFSTLMLLTGLHFVSVAQDNDYMKFRGGLTETTMDDGIQNGFYTVNYPGKHVLSMLTFTTSSSVGTFQMETSYWGQLRFRNRRDNIAWSDWNTIWHSGNLNLANIMQYRGGVTETTIDAAIDNGFYSVMYPGKHIASLFCFATPGTSTGPFQLEANFMGELRYRNKIDNRTWTNWNAIVTKDANGNVGIGTAPKSNYRLAVEGVLAARRIKVTQESWADFVFSPQYKLPPLQEVEQYIRQHQHLPEIPSAKEVEASGIDLGEMNKKLLQKVEELTLYILELKKENIKQQEQLDVLNKRIR
ncbi:MAG TPA: hypothetical protein VM802_07260 [Chitinophaga sp.]|uniref:hypothetical protein n=1 Tax=Chitinophaga sp. TaxID=1869181 RepID=UPI002C1B59DB|nr:hypothetical protein [Chitinophaga sp.]HVI44649.1 hypothetical protein [Chitinophaga sp.]